MFVARLRAFTACVKIKCYGSFARWRGDVGSLMAQRSQRGHVVAEKGLREELSGAPDALVDFHAGLRTRSAVARRRQLCGNQPVCRVHPTILHEDFFLGDDAADLARSSGEETASPRHNFDFHTGRQPEERPLGPPELPRPVWKSNLRRVCHPPRHRRDACSMAWRCRFLAARPSQDSRAIAVR